MSLSRALVRLPVSLPPSIYQKYREDITCFNWSVNTTLHAQFFPDTRLRFHISRTRHFFRDKTTNFEDCADKELFTKQHETLSMKVIRDLRSCFQCKFFSNKSTVIGKQKKKTFPNFPSNVQTKYNADLFEFMHQLTRIYTKSSKMFRYTYLCYTSQVFENRYFIVNIRENVYKNDRISSMTVTTAIKTYMRVLKRLRRFAIDTWIPKLGVKSNLLEIEIDRICRTVGSISWSESYSAYILCKNRGFLPTRRLPGTGFT